MSDAWDELRERLGPRGEHAARALLNRLEHLAEQRGWDCALHLAGVGRRATTFWVEPVLRVSLTAEGDKAQTRQ